MLFVIHLSRRADAKFIGSAKGLKTGLVDDISLFIPGEFCVCVASVIVNGDINDLESFNFFSQNFANLRHFKLCR